MAQIDDVAADWMHRVPGNVLASVSYGLTPDDTHVYGVPLNIHRLNTLFYNKALFEEIDIHPEEDLTDLAGMFTVAEKIKQFSQRTGRKIAPIALGYGEKQTWTLALVFFENLLVGRENWRPAARRAIYQQLFTAPEEAGRVLIRRGLRARRFSQAALVRERGRERGGLGQGDGPGAEGRGGDDDHGRLGQGLRQRRRLPQRHVRLRPDAGHGRDVRVHDRHVRAADRRQARRPGRC